MNLFSSLLPVLVDMPESGKEIIAKIVQAANILIPILGAIGGVIFLVKTIMKALEMSKAKSSGDQQGYQQAKSSLIWSVITALGCFSATLVFAFITDIVKLIDPSIAEYL